MNQPAFPRPASAAHSHGMHSPQEGMTLRDYFAAKAMQGILFEGLNEAETAENAYAIADEMLKAREA
jgi:hypothetical protein